MCCLVRYMLDVLLSEVHVGCVASLEPFILLMFFFPLCK